MNSAARRNKCHDLTRMKSYLKKNYINDYSFTNNHMEN